MEERQELQEMEIFERYTYVLDNILFINDLLEADYIIVPGQNQKFSIRSFVNLLTQGERLQENRVYQQIEGLKQQLHVNDNEEHQEAQNNLTVYEKREMIQHWLIDAMELYAQKGMPLLERYREINQPLLEEKDNKRR